MSGTPHTFHPPTLEVGLSDDCPRCSEHANDPLAQLDQEHVADLWRQMLEVEFGDGRYRSMAEARACRSLYQHARFLRTIGIDPRDVVPGQPYAPTGPPCVICGCSVTVNGTCPRCGSTR